MNKSAGALLGLVVTIGAISVGGAWYTGTKLEGVLQASIQDANKQLQVSMTGADGSATLELLSLDRQMFSSTAHYRLKAQGAMFGDAAEGLELLFVDHIEHGPLPFSRLVSLKWLPVMATSHYTLEKTPFTEQWFAAAKDVSPLKGVINLGYDRSAHGTFELLPLEAVLDDKTSLKFSGLNLEVAASAQAQKVKANGYMDHLTLSTIAEDQTPLKVELSGLTLASNLSKGRYDYYLGENTFELSDSTITFGDKQSVLTLKKAEVKGFSAESGSNVAARSDYEIGAIALDGKAIGSAKMAWSIKNLDLPASLSLMQIYQSKLLPYEAAVSAAEAAGEPVPALKLSDAEQAQVKVDLQKLLAAQPQVALEHFTLNTPNGESRASLVVDLSQPPSLDTPTDQLGKQLIALLDFKVHLSKPMIADLLSVQAQIEGQTDTKAIAEQASVGSEMFSSMAVATQLAKLEGNAIVSTLRYANKQVDFNGQKMTVEEFAGFLMNKFGGAGMLQ